MAAHVANEQQRDLPARSSRWRWATKSAALSSGPIVAVIYSNSGTSDEGLCTVLRAENNWRCKGNRTEEGILAGIVAVRLG
jgi:hypothetical protein